MQKLEYQAECGVFPTTHWTVINALKQAGFEDRQSLLVEFVEKYSSAFRLHLVHARGYRQEADIDDVIQGFLTDKFVFRNIFEHVSADRGRLRDYLRRCLDNYVYEQHRSKTSAAWDHRVPWEEADHAPSGAVSEREVCPFDVGWAKAVMTEAIIRTKDQFFHSQRQHVWDVFDLCIVRPLLSGNPAMPYTELAEKLGLTVKAVQNRRVSALRAFGKHLNGIIAEYVGNDPSQIDAEIASLNVIMQSGCFQDTPIEAIY